MVRVHLSPPDVDLKKSGRRKRGARADEREANLSQAKKRREKAAVAVSNNTQYEKEED